MRINSVMKGGMTIRPENQEEKEFCETHYLFIGDYVRFGMYLYLFNWGK